MQRILARAHERGERSPQEKLAALVPGRATLIASSSRHYIQLDQPKLVIGAIRSVVREARSD